MFDFRCDSIVYLMTQIQSHASAYSILPLFLAHLRKWEDSLSINS